MLHVVLALACTLPPEPARPAGSPTSTERIEPIAVAALRSLDQDGDGYIRWTGDCDDRDPAVHPGADDPARDGAAQNCDGVDGVDADGDGVAARGEGGLDCDDGDAAPDEDRGEVYFEAADGSITDYSDDFVGAKTAVELTLSHRSRRRYLRVGQHPDSGWGALVGEQLLDGRWHPIRDRRGGSHHSTGTVRSVGDSRS